MEIMSLPFVTVLCLYVAINAYMLARLSMTLAGAGVIRGIAAALFLLFSVSFPVSRLLYEYLPDRLYGAFAFMGALYLAPMIYGFILTVITDVLRLLNGVVTLTPNPPPFTVSGRTNVVMFVTAASIAITLAGAFNAKILTVVRQDIEWKSPSASEDLQRQLKIALISDIHLGRMVGANHLAKIVDLTNDQRADIVLIAGDLFDDDSWLADGEKRAEATRLFSSFTARLGTWAVPGNHDYYAGIDRVAEFLAGSGVRLLRDEWAAPEGELLLAGRDDRSVAAADRNRADLDEILRGADALRSGEMALPLVVMDHQPFDLGDSQAAGAALQVSGHTHRGQLFPVNFIVAAIYEKHYGLYNRGDTRYFISSGAGTWGPPVRTSGRPEIVILTLNIM
jgi:predicted MPP superfamily phosphohydrolase